MMKAKHLIFFTLILLFAAQTAKGQSGITDKIGTDEYERGFSLDAIERNAVAASKDGDHYAAMIYYRRILESDSLHQQALKGYGAAAMEMGAYERAEWAYQLLVNEGMTGPDGMPIVNLADAKFQLGKYPEAKALFRNLIIETPVGITPEVLEKAERGLENCDFALDVTKNGIDSVTQVDTLKNINTDYADFAPYLKGDSTLFYSSYSFPYEKDERYPKRYWAKTLYVSTSSDTLKPELAPFNEENQHTANVTFNEKGDVMYYTVCSFIEKTAKIRCDIYKRKLTGNNVWGPAEKLPPHINMPGDSITNTEPSVGHIPGEDVEVLYFVSDRPGGKGKRDLWYSRILADSLSQPINLDTLNTKENDVTPFYHVGTGTLYFSTNGRPTLGGYDIYRSKGNSSGWEKPANMGMPINSTGNDISLVITENGKVGYFASTRKGANTFKADEKGELEYEQPCCYDIFKAPVEKPEMIAVACEGATGKPLEGVHMRLYQITSKGEAVEEMKTTVKDSDRFNFPVQPRRSYMIIMSKPKYTTDTLKFNTPATVWKDTIIKTLCLKSAKPHLIVTVFDKKTGEPLPGATVNFRTLSRKLADGSMERGKNGGLLAFLSKVNELANRFDYPVEFEHRYNAQASKRGYLQDSTDEISTEGIPDADTLRRELRLTRGVLFSAHTLNMVTRDTLYGVTFRLVEIEGGSRTEQYVNPPGTIYYETTVHYDRAYLVIATKDGFTSDTVEFSTKDLSHTSFEHIKRELRLRPLTVQAYLPISLYFDNDEPDKRTMKTTTARVYQPTYISFYRRKPEFLEKYVEGLEGAEKQAATDSIEYFFEKEVRAGWEKLFFFSEDLLKMMERGDYIELTLRGFASPRANSAYNLNLTKRRVASVNNHFLKHDGGIYKPFVDNGQIKIKLEPNGENLAPKDISDDAKDDRRSLYAPRASRERRLEIIGVEVRRGTNSQQTETPSSTSAPTNDK